MSPSLSVVHEVLPVVVLLLPVHGSRQPDKLQPCRGPGRRPAPDGQPGPVPRPPVLSYRHRDQPPGNEGPPSRSMLLLCFQPIWQSLVRQVFIRKTRTLTNLIKADNLSFFPINISDISFVGLLIRLKMSDRHELISICWMLV